MACLTKRETRAATNAGYGEMIAVGFARGTHSREPLSVEHIGERWEVVLARPQLLPNLIVPLAGVPRSK